MDNKFASGQVIAAEDLLEEPTARIEVGAVLPPEDFLEGATPTKHPLLAFSAQALADDPEFDPEGYAVQHFDALWQDAALLKHLAEADNLRRNRPMTLGRAAALPVKAVEAFLEAGAAIPRMVWTTAETGLELTQPRLVSALAGTSDDPEVAGTLQREAVANLRASLEYQSQQTGAGLLALGQEVDEIEGAAMRLSGEVAQKVADKAGIPVPVKAITEAVWPDPANRTVDQRADDFLQKVALRHTIEQSKVGQGPVAQAEFLPEGAVRDALALDLADLRSRGVEIDPQVVEDLGLITDVTEFIPAAKGFTVVAKGRRLLSAPNKALAARGVASLRQASASAARKAAGVAKKVSEVPPVVAGAAGAALDGGTGALGGVAVPRASRVAAAGLTAGAEVLEGTRKLPGADALAAVARSAPVRGAAKGLLAPFSPELDNAIPLAAAFGEGGAEGLAEAVGSTAAFGTFGGGTAGLAQGGAEAAQSAARDVVNRRFQEIQREPIQEFEYGTDAGLDAAHKAQMAAVRANDPKAANSLNWLRATALPEGSELYILPKDVFSAQVAKSLGQPEGTQFDTPGFIETRPDGSTRVFLNETTTALGHEVGHAIVAAMAPDTRANFLAQVRSAYGPEQLAQFGKFYDAALSKQKGAESELMAGNEDRIVNEVAAEMLTKALYAEPLDNVPPSLGRKIIGGLAQFAEATTLYRPQVGQFDPNSGASALGVTPSVKASDTAMEFLRNAQTDPGWMAGPRPPVIPPTPAAPASPQPSSTAQQSPEDAIVSAAQSQGVRLIPLDYSNNPIYDPATGNVTRVSGRSPIVSMADRQIVVVNVNGIPVPFYRSTGKAGKKNVAKDKWYPIFGIASDGWINKGTEAQISSYYGSPELQAIAEALDRSLGATAKGTLVSAKAISGSVNQMLTDLGLSPVENGTSTSVSDLARNIKAVLDAIKFRAVQPSPAAAPATPAPATPAPATPAPATPAPADGMTRREFLSGGIRRKTPPSSNAATAAGTPAPSGMSTSPEASSSAPAAAAPAQPTAVPPVIPPPVIPEAAAPAQPTAVPPVIPPPVIPEAAAPASTPPAAAPPVIPEAAAPAPVQPATSAERLARLRQQTPPEESQRPQNMRVTPEEQAALDTRKQVTGVVDAERAVQANPEVYDETARKAFADINAALQRPQGQVAPVRLAYRSVTPAQGGAANARVRKGEQDAAYARERDLALQGLPSDVRTLFDKVTIPYRWNVSGDNVNVFAMSLDKVLTNARTVARRAEAAGAADLIPYATVGGNMTPAAAREFAGDLRTYTVNQANGYAGSGASVTQPAGYRGQIPEVNPNYRPTTLDQRKADFINLLMAISPPATNRVTADARARGSIPNVEAAKLAAANQRPVVQARTADPARNEYRVNPAVGVVQPTPITETNPLRDEFARRGVDFTGRNLFQVTENLNLQDIQSVTPAPESGFRAPSKDLIQAGFMPEAPKLADDRTSGKAFKNFFSAVTSGEAKYRPNSPWKNLLPLDAQEPFLREYDKHTGNFDAHIGTSIPGYKDVQVRVGNAVASVYGQGGRVLDIGASEGSWAKTISALSGGRVQTVALDPNPAMANFFKSKSQVPGATYDTRAFREGFEDEGVVIQPFDSAQPFDVVHEAMVFQFISPERAAQLDEVKRLMTPDGVFFAEEKFKTSPEEWAANEDKKDREFKDLFYSRDQLAAKQAVVKFQQDPGETKAVGMVDNMVTPDEFEAQLAARFKHVAQYWDSGNFKGYAASDSAEALARMLAEIGDLNTDFSNTPTPRAVQGGRSMPRTEAETGRTVTGRSFMPEVDQDLVALHNTSEGGLREALRLGGIPLPSLATTRKDIPFSGYGNITLIAPRRVVDPEADPKNRVFAADAYTVRQPRPEVRPDGSRVIPGTEIPYTLENVAAYMERPDPRGQVPRDPDKPFPDVSQLEELRTVEEMRQRKSGLVQEFDSDGDTTDRGYFEAKPQRPVRLSEFAGAVVPENTDPELVRQLQSLGLEVETYKGGPQQRREVVEAVAERTGAAFMPSVPDFASTFENTTATWERLSRLAARNPGVARILEQARFDLNRAAEDYDYSDAEMDEELRRTVQSKLGEAQLPPRVQQQVQKALRGGTAPSFMPTAAEYEARRAAEQTGPFVVRPTVRARSQVVDTRTGEVVGPKTGFSSAFQAGQEAKKRNETVRVMSLAESAALRSSKRRGAATEDEPKTPTGWVLPNGEYIGVPVDARGIYANTGDFHGGVLVNQAEDFKKRFGLKEPDRLEALKKGFVRVRLDGVSGRLGVEALASVLNDPKRRGVVESVIRQHGGKLSKIVVNGFNERGKVTLSDEARVISGTPEEKVAAFRELLPSRAGAFMPRVIPDDVARAALSSDRQPKFGSARDTEPGTEVGLRVDIPAFLRTGNYVVSVHEKATSGRVGKILGYDSKARVTDPTFFVNEAAAERIRDGQPKFPIATVEGRFAPDQNLPEDLSDWLPVGMNPKRHSYFYDKNSDRPVVSGSEAVLVGNTVYVKDPVFGEASDFRFMPRPESPARRTRADIDRNTLPPGQAQDLDSWVSTRMPWAEGYKDAGFEQDLIVGTEDVFGYTSDAQSKLNESIKDTPGMGDLKGRFSDVVYQFRDRLVDNLLLLHDAMPGDFRNRAQLWYDGARVLAERFAKQYGVRTDQAAAVLATLSPQMDWYVNVHLADMVLEAVTQQQNTRLPEASVEWVRRKLSAIPAETERSIRKDWPEEKKALKRANGVKAVQKLQKALSNIEGRTLAETAPEFQPFWVRAYSERNGKLRTPTVTPEGTVLPNVTAGSTRWQNYGAIAKAINSVNAPDRNRISQLVGKQHKVRNFYNNILLPALTLDDVTVDTHAIAAALMLPYPSSADAVAVGLGDGGQDATSGSQGLYGVYADAYRIAAAKRGIMARQMQSITWEALRGIYLPRLRAKKAPVRVAIEKLFRDRAKAGGDVAESVRQAIDIAGGFRLPGWFTGVNGYTKLADWQAGRTDAAEVDDTEDTGDDNDE